MSNTIPNVQSTYTSMFIESNQKLGFVLCGGQLYPYVILSISVNATGSFRFKINSTIDINLYLYQHQFNPINRYWNLLLGPDVRCEVIEKQLESHLMINTKYILIITAGGEETRDKFSITSSGPSQVIFNSMSELKDLKLYLFCV